MAGQRGIAELLLGELCEGGLQCSEQLGLQLAVQLVPGIVLGNIASDVGVEQQGVADVIAVFAEAADGDINVDAGAGVDNAEGNGVRGAVLVADDLLGVEVVYALILGDLAAEGEALADLLEHFQNAGAQIAGEDGGLGGGVIDEFAGLGTDFHDFALLHDEHALSVRNCNDGAGGDDVVASLGVAGAAGGFLSALYNQNVLAECFAVEVFFPLVSQYAADRAQCCMNQSHN